MAEETQKKITSVKKIIEDAGGEIVGKTRLQKIAYLFTVTGLEDNFEFTYKHYGPFSDILALSTNLGVSFGTIEEEQGTTKLGNSYFIYKVSANSEKEKNIPRSQLASLAIEFSAIELELAATAIYLYKEEKFKDPWAETKRRKPEKTVGGRLEGAGVLLEKLKEISVPKSLGGVPSL